MSALADKTVMDGAAVLDVAVTELEQALAEIGIELEPVCARCGGSGEIWACRPYRGAYGYDPQEAEPYECPTCEGSGAQS